jgi:hypothetical protein
VLNLISTDKATADILEGISSLQKNMTVQTDHLGRLNERLIRVETALARGGSLFAGNGHSVHSNYVPDTSNAPPTSDQISHLQMMVEDDPETEPGPPVPPGEPAIPINHTTLAGLLLEWPAIRDMTKYHLEREGIRFIGEYPIGQEQKRGSLSLYGRGEDSHLSSHNTARTDYGSFDGGEESPGMRSPSPASDTGQLPRLGSPSTSDMAGVFGFDGKLDFAENKVWSYVDSFTTHILSMHPIIQPKYLHYLVKNLLATLPKPPKPFIPQTAEVPGSKRKRSPDPSPHGNASISGVAKSWKPSRSSHNALVLVILALGKICQYRNSIPDLVNSSTELLHQGPVVKNYDVIPGLEYFAYATDILGNITGAYNNMKDVYANIFASLYYGQLCRPLESYAYIHKASHKLQVIIRP